MSTSVFEIERAAFHKRLLKSLLCIGANGVPGNADKDSKASVGIALHIANALQAETGTRASGQSSGADFEDIVAQFVDATFLKLPHLRPGRWTVRRVSGRGRAEISKFAQYAHIAALQEAADNNPQLAAALGNEYLISPDVVVTRGLESNDVINGPEALVDDDVSRLADLREGDGKEPLLHASISTKWTIRSDRAQNARSEALNLIRNRKGRQPHIVVVTGEPLPGRLCSLALGTGDIDCVYHFALYELVEAVSKVGSSDAQEMLSIMIEGKRLKDISDLPLDLAV